MNLYWRLTWLAVEDHQLGHSLGLLLQAIRHSSSSFNLARRGERACPIQN
jgi:hypothetical protein